jgi:hypothetical protein
MYLPGSVGTTVFLHMATCIAEPTGLATMLGFLIGNRDNFGGVQYWRLNSELYAY